MLTDLHAFNTGIRTTHYDSKIKSNLAIIDSYYNIAHLEFEEATRVNPSILSDDYIEGCRNFSKQDIIESALTKVIFHLNSGRNIIQEYDEAILYYFDKLKKFGIIWEEKVTKVRCRYMIYIEEISPNIRNLFEVIKEKREIFIARIKQVLADIEEKIPLLYRVGELDQKREQLKEATDNLEKYLQEDIIQQRMIEEELEQKIKVVERPSDKKVQAGCFLTLVQIMLKNTVEERFR